MNIKLSIAQQSDPRLVLLSPVSVRAAENIQWKLDKEQNPAWDTNIEKQIHSFRNTEQSVLYAQ